MGGYIGGDGCCGDVSGKAGGTEGGGGSAGGRGGRGVVKFASDCGGKSGGSGGGWGSGDFGGGGGADGGVTVASAQMQVLYPFGASKQGLRMLTFCVPMVVHSAFWLAMWKGSSLDPHSLTVRLLSTQLNTYVSWQHESSGRQTPLLAPAVEQLLSPCWEKYTYSFLWNAGQPKVSPLTPWPYTSCLPPVLVGIS